MKVKRTFVQLVEIKPMNSVMMIKILKVSTLLISSIAIAYSVLYSNFNKLILIFLAIVILLQILYYFPSKLNYPGKVTDQNREMIYPIAQSILVQIAFLVSLMMLVLSIQFYTTIVLGLLAGVVLLVAIKGLVSVYAYLD